MPLSARCVRTIRPFGKKLCALWGELLYCGPLTRAIFRLVFRRGEKQTD